jgi:hypothetical protein
MDAIAADARLYMLKELAAQNDGHLNEILIQRLLDMRYGINRSREWVQTQLRKLEELGAIEIHGGGELLIAHIVRPGRDHLEERSVIAGITRPAEIE